MYEDERPVKDFAGFPGVPGAIDGCNIEIKAPDDIQTDFVDRANRHNVNLMAICDAGKRFTYIFQCLPGSAHGSNVFRLSLLNQTIPSILHHIVEDSAFQLNKNMLVPFKVFVNITLVQRKYNKIFTKTKSWKAGLDGLDILMQITQGYPI